MKVVRNKFPLSLLINWCINHHSAIASCSTLWTNGTGTLPMPGFIDNCIKHPNSGCETIGLVYFCFVNTVLRCLCDRYQVGSMLLHHTSFCPFTSSPLGYLIGFCHESSNKPPFNSELLWTVIETTSYFCGRHVEYEPKKMNFKRPTNPPEWHVLPRCIK